MNETQRSPQQEQMNEEGGVPNVTEDAKSGFGEDLNKTADQDPEGDNISKTDDSAGDTPENRDT